MALPDNTDDATKDIRVFQLNDEKAAFEELEIDPEVELHELLKSNLVLYFINPKSYRSFIWAGAEASTRMKFIAANAATKIRDKIGPAIKISTMDEDEESKGFKIMIGLESAIEFVEEQTGPAYEGKAEDEVMLEEMTLAKIVLTLEKLGNPEGLIREMVIEGNNIYGYQETYKKYMGELIKERKLYPLEDKVPDGTYQQEKLFPRILMSYNRVILVELFRKMDQEETDQEIQEIQKLAELKQIENPFSENA
ncbi:MAG: hypothetical protein ACTSYI_07270 [Promethearchaeota archaeon]